MRYSVFENGDGTQTTLVRALDTQTVPKDSNGYRMQNVFVIEADQVEGAQKLYDQWLAERTFCDHCGCSHVPNPCCGETDCFCEPYSCRRCGATYCDSCGSGSYCADCDVDVMVEQAEGRYEEGA
jgi:hypothetical protein